MTNPHAPSFAKKHNVIQWALTLALGLAACNAQAQSAEALEWQPGQIVAPLVVSTPHNDIRKLLRQAKYPQALLLVNKGLANNPNDPQMRFWQGFIFEQLGQPDMAAQVYQGLTQSYPELAEPHNNLGVIYAAKGDYPNARASFEAALRANPKYATAHENMGDLMVNMARQSYERALLMAATPVAQPARTTANQVPVSLPAVTPYQKRLLTQKIERLKPVLELTQDKP